LGERGGYPAFVLRIDNGYVEQLASLAARHAAPKAPIIEAALATDEVYLHLHRRIPVRITAMDYDQTEIALTYDKARVLAPETVRLWQDLLSAHIDRNAISLVIDLGCGTGRFSELLAAHFGVQVIGIDPSEKMVSQARRKRASGKVTYRQGSAEALPLADGCADLVFMSMIYHHLTDPSAVAQECRRVLHQGGYVCIRNGTREGDFPHRHFFPALRPLIASDLPSRRDISEWLQSPSPSGSHPDHRPGLVELRREICPSRRLVPGAAAG
jgi:SAM-dependent methyltransferase